ncbi:MAG: deacylase [Gammaproteobacteria bacterium]|nr:deacylase [Gammaproteobacteria bacterium]MCP5299710.1 deacylase [Chromatiaceae bacterium]
MRVALRVEVHTLHGLGEGVPRLMRLFSDYQVRASFFFPFGRDLSGREPLSAWRARRHIGRAALLYGTLLPAPRLGEQSARLMRLAASNGHDVGLLGGSPLLWRRRLANAGDGWVAAQLHAAWRACNDVMPDQGPAALATPAWQTAPAVLGAVNAERFRYTSMTRGRMPYLPLLQGVRSDVVEIPTTLPTVDEMLRQPGVDTTNVHEYLYAESQHVRPAGHVFSLTAEREGGDRFALLEKLIVMWKGQEGSVRALQDVLHDLQPSTLPRHQVGWAIPQGGDAYQATQSIEVPA